MNRGDFDVLAKMLFGLCAIVGAITLISYLGGCNDPSFYSTSIGAHP